MLLGHDGFVGYFWTATGLEFVRWVFYENLRTKLKEVELMKSRLKKQGWFWMGVLGVLGVSLLGVSGVAVAQEDAKKEEKVEEEGS